MTVILLCLLVILTLLSRFGIVFKAITTALIILAYAFWYISDMFTGNGVTDAVFYHLLNSAQGTSLDDIVDKVAVAAVFIAIILATVAAALYIKFKKRHFTGSRWANVAWAGVLIATVCMPFSRNIYLAIKETFLTPGNGYAVSSQYHKLNGELPKKYNFVFIYAESLEHTFRALDGKNYLPGLDAIANHYLDFTNIQQPLNMGFGWTMGGIVNTQCGIPLVMSQGNAGSNVSHFLSGANCIATWLTQQGYQTEFIRGSQKEFAGGDKFLSQHGWQAQHDKAWFEAHSLATPEQISGWGVHDDAMLDHAWNEYQRLSQAGKPFLLSFLTVDTHPPAGTYIPECDNHIEKSSEYPMLTAVACSDYMLSRFINKITQSEGFDNTIVVLVSDHLMMANGATSLLAKDEAARRNNFIVIKKDLHGSKNSTQGTLLDVWPTVLDLAGLPDKTLGFGKSLLDNTAGQFINDYVKGHARDYLAYASELWNYPSVRDPMVQKENSIQIGSQRYKLPLYSFVNENGRFKSLWFDSFAKTMARQIKPEDTFFYANLCQNMSINRPGICAYVVSPSEVKQLHITTAGIVDQKRVKQKSTLYQSGLLGISVGEDVYDYSGATLPEVFLPLPPGINFFAAKPHPTIMYSYASCALPRLPEEEMNAFLQQKNEAMIFSSNDSIACGDRSTLNQLARLLNIEALHKLQPRQQIVGLYTPEKTDYVIGAPNQHLDAFVDMTKPQLITLCRAFFDCP